MKINIPAPTDDDLNEIYQHNHRDSVKPLSVAFRESKELNISLTEIVERSEKLLALMPEQDRPFVQMAIFRSTFGTGFVAGYLFSLLKSGHLTPPVSKETDGSGI